MISDLDLYLQGHLAKTLSKYCIFRCVCSVASTIMVGFFPLFAQMITIRRGCVAYNDFWPSPISSRSFGQNFVKILHILLCLLCSIYNYGWILTIVCWNDHHKERMCWCNDIEPCSISLRSFGLNFVKILHILLCPLCSIYNLRGILTIFGSNDNPKERMCSVK